MMLGQVPAFLFILLGCRSYASLNRAFEPCRAARRSWRCGAICKQNGQGLLWISTSSLVSSSRSFFGGENQPSP